MSWNVSMQGTHVQAEDAVTADPHVPVAIRTAAHHVLQAVAADAQVMLSTNGHIDTTGRGNATISVRTIAEEKA